MGESRATGLTITYPVIGTNDWDRSDLASSMFLFSFILFSFFF